jgi:hypothetical protein
VEPDIEYAEAGLYMLAGEYETYAVDIEAAAGTRLGRVALGIASHIPTSPAKGLGYMSSAEDGLTEAGQVISGEGGYRYRTLSLDSRYKIGPETMERILAGYATVGSGFPMFIDLGDEADRLPARRFYGVERGQQSWVFQGGVDKYLYSLKFDLEECF